MQLCRAHFQRVALKILILIKSHRKRIFGAITELILKRNWITEIRKTRRIIK